MVSSSQGGQCRLGSGCPLAGRSDSPRSLAWALPRTEGIESAVGCLAVCPVAGLALAALGVDKSKARPALGRACQLLRPRRVSLGIDPAGRETLRHRFPPKRRAEIEWTYLRETVERSPRRRGAHAFQAEAPDGLGDGGPLLQTTRRSHGEGGHLTDLPVPIPSEETPAGSLQPHLPLGGVWWEVRSAPRPDSSDRSSRSSCLPLSAGRGGSVFSPRAE